MAVSTKDIRNIVLIAHSGTGKTTLVENLLFKGGTISKKGSVDAGTTISDYSTDEKARKNSINMSIASYEKDGVKVNLIDAPGFLDYAGDVVAGLSAADAAILLVDSVAGIETGTNKYWKRAEALNLPVLIVVNKMDAVDYKEDKYNSVKEDVSKLLKGVGINPETTSFIACSGLKGEGIFNKSKEMPWYKGSSIIEQMDQFPQPELPSNLPMRMPVQDVYEITGIGTVPVGKIETGVMKVGQKVMVLPGRTGKGIAGEVKTIEAHHETLPEAIAGDNVGINIRGVGKKDIARGDVICDAATPIPVVEEFIATITVINHPSVLAKGYTPVFHVHTAQVPCQFTELIAQIDPRSGEIIKENPDFLKNGDTARVRLRPQGNLCLETQKDNPFTSRFAVRDAGQTVAAGMCTEIVKSK